MQQTHRSTFAALRAPLLAALAFGCLFANTMASADQPRTAAPLPAALIAEVLDIDGAMQARIDASRPPEGPHTLVYIDNPVPRLQLLQMTLQIDDRPPIYYVYGLDESLALESLAIHRLASVAMSPGTHKLYAEYVARYPEDRPGTPRLRSRLVQNIEQPAGTSAVQVTLAEKSFGREPELSLKQWTPVAGGLDIAELHAIDLFIATGHELRAASELMSLQRRNGGLPGDFAERLNHCMDALRTPAFIAPSPTPLLMQYQAAVAASDLNALDRIGSEKPESEEMWTIRDKANAELGYQLLQKGQGVAADAAFRRVRSPGPESSAALLGLGWAQLAPKKGEAFKTTPPTAIMASLSTRPSPFSNAWESAGKNEADSLRRALVPWIELIGRDPTDESVQESMLALPYAMDHLGAHRQAVVYAQRAVDQLENTRKHLEQALVHVSSGQMESLAVERQEPAGNGWTWWLTALPEPRWWLAHPPEMPDNFYLERLFEDDEFRSQLLACRRLFELDRLLDQHERALSGDDNAQLKSRITALRGKLAAASRPERETLKQIATRDVQDIKRQTETYLVEAHFAMARMNDRPTTRATP